MEPEDLLRIVTIACEQLQLPYFVTGSTATIAYGEPRFTNDIDVVIDLPADKIGPFFKIFSGCDFYLSESAIVAAVKNRSQFNLIHPASGLKVDFMVVSRTDFDRSRMSRVRQLPVLEDVLVRFASPEDAILMKLKYYQMGQSDKHVRDIQGVLKIQGEKIDRSYISRRCSVSNVVPHLQQRIWWADKSQQPDHLRLAALNSLPIELAQK